MAIDMIPDDVKKRMEKQQYIVVGNHSTVKICGWCKNYIRDRGGCYKFKFYGIRSHQCLQMSTSLSCANRCIYCWRDYKAPVCKEWNWPIDDPDEIIEGSLKAQKKLLSGFGGNYEADKKLWKESNEVKHVALSLTGEPITYPRFNELLEKFHKRGISTFVVTNAQYPEKIKELKMVTQLYISVDAPDKKSAKEIGKPLFPDYWERLEKSLTEMKNKKFRTTIRMTMLKEMNMTKDAIPGFKHLVGLADPDFIEVKGYMFVGSSRQRLKIENMPRHEEVREFAEEFLKELPEYEITNEQKESRVVLLSKKKFKGNTWIDFDAFFRLLKEKNPEEIESLEYSTKVRKIKEADIEEIHLD
jgi:tRNA wybutosine-synthesizing protein 1